MIAQTLAIMLDAIRRLRDQKMFWIALMLSAAVVVNFAGVGINETGIKLFIWQIDLADVNTVKIPEANFYKGMVFGGVGVNIWLSTLALLLAIVSTASIMPDLVSSGSIPLILSKPISRVRVFLTTYASGLLFVGLQVLIFTAGSFFVLGFRGAGWDGRLFVAVPIVVCVFSYLYCVCAVIGAVTRSTLTALLVTTMFWAMLFGLHATDVQLLALIHQNLDQQDDVELRIARLTRQQAKAQRDADAMEKALAALDAQSASQPRQGPQGPTTRADRTALAAAAQSMRANCKRIETQLAETRTRREQLPESMRSLVSAHGLIFSLKSVLPKTVETAELTKRILLDDHRDTTREELLAEFNKARRRTAAAARAHNDGSAGPFDRVYQDAEYVQDEFLKRGAMWSVGSSLLFELVVLAIGAAVFQRRDF